MIKAKVMEISHDEATIIMVDSNLQRTIILPSEKAFSYRMRLEAIKRLPGRPKENCTPVGHNYIGEKSVSVIADSSPDSKTQVQRFIRLTHLIPELLELVDESVMALRPAVELSYLKQEDQELVLEQITSRECTPSHAQTIRMRKLSDRGMLDEAAIKKIMKEDKPNQVEKIHIPYSEIRQYIPRGISYEKTGEYIKKALEFYQKHRKTG